MFRRSPALAALAVAAALVPTAPAAAAPTLAHRVRTLEAKLGCLQKYPVYAFGDYAYFEFETEAVDKGGVPDSVDVLVPPVPTISAIDFDYGANPDPSDAYLLGVKRSSRCLAKFRTAPNPVSFARVVATAKLNRLQ
jgi:hypothetical protein